MGESSRVVFERWVIEQATRPELSSGAPRQGVPGVLHAGRPRGLAEGKVQIVTPTATIELHGTAVCLRVAPDGTTTVAVLEGEVTVRGAAAGAVRVPQGRWTDVAAGASRPGRRRRSARASARCRRRPAAPPSPTPPRCWS